VSPLNLGLLPQIRLHIEGAGRSISEGIARAPCPICGCVGEAFGVLAALARVELVDVAKLLEVDEEVAARLADLLVPLPHRVRLERDLDFGPVLAAEVDASAREALGPWLRLAEALRGVHVVVEWAGELVDHLVRVALAGGYRPKALPGFDAVRLVAEGRERRPT